MNQLTRIHPLFSMLSDLQQEMNRFLQPSQFNRESRAANIMVTDWVPAIDIKDEGNQYVIKADVPGVDPKDIQVQMEDGALVIQGKREASHEEKTENYLFTERSRGTFYRSFSLPQSIESTKIKAKNINGVLTITVPKAEKSTAKKIPVES